MDDFEQADADAGVITDVVVETPSREGNPNSAVATRPNHLPADVVEYRAQLLKAYHAGAPSLAERIKRAGKDDMESTLVALIEEIITETDHLLGNELVATQNGELRDASVISYKRAEVLEKAIQRIEKKKEMDNDRGIDVDSTAMIVIYRFFMSKCKETFDRMNVGDEIRDLFFRLLGEIMENWKKELRNKFDEVRASGGLRP